MLSLTKITAFLLVFMLMNACTVEKRLYRKGFHMEWKKHPATVDKEDAETASVTEPEAPAPESSPQPAIAQMMDAEQLEARAVTESGALNAVPAGDEVLETAPVYAESTISNAGKEPELTRENEKNHRGLSQQVFVMIAVLLFLFMLLSGCAVLVLLTVGPGFGAPIITFAIVFILLLAGFVFLVVYNNRHGEKKSTEKPIEPEEPVIPSEEETSPEKWTKAEEAQRKKRRGIIAASVLLAAVALIIYLGSR